MEKYYTINDIKTRLLISNLDKLCIDVRIRGKNYIVYQKVNRILRYDHKYEPVWEYGKYYDVRYIDEIDRTIFYITEEQLLKILKEQ